jgi:8-oxo-dGTP diphosphatase
MPYNVRCSILVVREHAALLVHRTRDGLDDWVLPGGTPCEGESLMACARRELIEETGVSADPSRVAFVVESASPGAGCALDIVFVAAGPGVSREYRREPGMEPSFISADQLARLVIRPVINGQLIRLLDPGPKQQHAAYIWNRMAGIAADKPPPREPAIPKSLARTRVPRWAGSW